MQRVGCSGTIRLPAVPALVDEYVKLCADVFGASGRGFSAGELDEARQVLARQLADAFAESPRSKLEICFQAEPSRPLGYQLKQDLRSIADAYEGWVASTDGPLFGAHPDARIMSLVGELSEPQSCPILDFGAGTGRNALALARLGFPVDAVEITPRFAEMLRASAAAEGLTVRVIVDDVLRNWQSLPRDYRLIVASEVVPDFRGVSDLRRFLEFGSNVLCEGGLLVFNLHLCAQGFTPDKAARELSQQCYSCLFTPLELGQAVAGLPFRILAEDSVHDFEKDHLPEGQFPPTPWYANWTTGLDVYELDDAGESCPVEMRWLLFQKDPAGGIGGGAGPTSQGRRAPRFDPATLRKAVVRRLIRRLSASGTLTLPALPALTDTYTEMCCALFGAMDRKPDVAQTTAIRNHLERVLQEAFGASQHSSVRFTYEVPFGEPLRYTAAPDPVPMTEAYAEWHEALGDSLFGVQPDARVVSIVTGVPEPSQYPVLDMGAGTGRNALHLGRAGHPVDAIEMTPSFADSLRVEARAQSLPIRVIARDMLECMDELRRDYQLILLSGTAGDLRGTGPLRRIFEIAADVLSNGGLLLLNMHVAVQGYSPDETARQWSQQCRATMITRSELAQAIAGLPLELVTDESAHDFEQANLPESDWPPTPVFTEWALGQHMYALEREQCPIELRWLLFRLTGGRAKG